MPKRPARLAVVDGGMREVLRQARAALVKSGGVAAAMSGSPVIQGRIALDNAFVDAIERELLVGRYFVIAPVPLPVDATNVATFNEEWWLAPTTAVK